MFVKTNTLKAIKEYYHNSLGTDYSKEEINILLEIVIEHFLGFTKLDSRFNDNHRLSESELLHFHFTLKRLKTNEPIQYILEVAPFMGLNFKVNKQVLIPRPETEELVDLILKTVSPNSKIIDIGTGSGCIPIALKKKLPLSKIVAIDIDNDALLVAQENSATNKTEIEFICSDILLCENLINLVGFSPDVIVSNPPYISELEKTEMQSQVLNFEPAIALFVKENDVLIFYKKIAELAMNSLKNSGHLFFEINQKYGKEVAEILLLYGFKKIKIIKDINGNDRMIHAQKG